MAILKIGRNEPCPCGSGKKYKKCCGQLEELAEISSDPFIHYSQLILAAKAKLDSHYQSGLRKIRNEAKELFLRFTTSKTLPQQNESIFSDWLWFDKTDSKGNTLGYYYLKENGNFMETNLKSCLSALVMSYLSVYEIIKAEERTLTVKDIFLNREEKVLLKEPWEEEKNPGSYLLLGRILKLPQTSLFSGMVLLAKNEPETRDFIIKHMEYLQEVLREDISWLLKFKGEILYGIFDHALHKTWVNLHDMRYIPLNQGEKDIIIAKLQENPAYELLHSTLGINWFRPTCPNRGYIRIAVSDDYAVACADVLEDVYHLKETIKNIFPDKECQVLNSFFLTRPPSPETADIWFTIMKDYETERWLDMPYEQTEGKTPRQLLQEENGRQKVAQMLKEFASRATSEPQKELITYMQARIN
ncbi:SEC-C motif-containing protein [Thermosyntropha lipolytica DSM 11003]|uniref:SEC-C motif-containing protein n=1 Tax=Thermosyntropha lipolytica DSM 11003 TaxID=1123382 RepID=A0A1M5MN19_9FIRM|nr:SEC-C motif-containing protein [Thermosyntropha lipolytica DSM 11003]